MLLSILSPEQGESLNRQDVMVQGKAFHSQDLETGVIVNGVLALVDGNTFVANHVPLLDGQNTITAVATDNLGNTSESTVTIQTDTTGDYIKLISSKESGLPPLDFTLRVNGTFSVVDPVISYSGPGMPTVEVGTELNEFDVTLTEPGFYFFSVETTDSQSNVFSDTMTITVTNPVVLEALLKKRWLEMSEFLLAGQIPAALPYFVATSQNKFNEIFTILGSDGINTIISDISNLKLLSQFGRAAHSGAIRYEDGSIYSYPVNFVQDENGIWRIMDF
jgi:hypothetical protein